MELMAILPTDLMELAQRLVAENSECSQRSAVSRAHYAAFHACRAFAALHPSFNPNASGSHHKALANFLMRFDVGPNDRDRTVREVGRVFDQLRALRNRADYSIHLEFSAGRAQAAILLARNILERIPA